MKSNLLSAVVSWWRSAAGAVKHTSSDQNFGPSGWKRHVRGWQAALVMVGVVAVATLLVVPRPVIPSELPLPRPDRDEQRRAALLDAERSRRARSVPLAYEVRAVGEALRRQGLAETSAAAERAHAASASELRRAVQASLRAHGVEPLLTLCAVQTELFLQALAQWERSGVAPRDLTELGGSFLTRARAQRWIDGDGRLRLAKSERAALFRMRWLDLTGLRKTRGFKPSLGQWRAYYRIFLERGPGPVDGQLAIVTALSKIDPEYPAELATGILLLWLGDRERASRALRAHLAGPRSGFWRLRARNALAAAVQL